MSPGILRNPEATVHIIQGNAGNKYPSDPIEKNESLIYSKNVYGVGKLIVFDASTIQI